jgi:hypothetical protein
VAEIHERIIITPTVDAAQITVGRAARHTKTR